MDHYLDRQLLAKAKVLRSKKLERPQVLLQDWHPIYLYLASGANLTGGGGSHSCVFRIKKPSLK